MNTFLKISLVALSLSPIAAQASTKYNCEFMGNRGTAQLEVLPTKDDASLAVVKIDIHATVKGGQTHLVGLLSVNLSNDGINGSGVIETQDGAIVNPELVTIAGDFQPDRSFTALLYDGDRVLQSGFGLPTSCKPAK